MFIHPPACPPPPYTQQKARDSAVHLPWETDWALRHRPTQEPDSVCLVLGWGMGVPWVPILSPALKNTINGAAQEGREIGLVVGG